MRNHPYQQALKRAIDVAVAATVLLVCLPLLACVALWIRRRMGRPVLFRQRRPGLDERPFTLYKFRTMDDARGPDGQLLPDAQRLTRLGRFLRRTSLDELPQLWNVLRGEMSLVGPRPLLMDYLAAIHPANRPPARRSGRASPAGPKSTAATRPPGSSASPMTFGTSNTGASGWIAEFSA